MPASQAVAFASAARCDSDASGPVSPCNAMMSQTASVVSLSLIGGRLREKLPRAVVALLLDDFVRDSPETLFWTLIERGATTVPRRP